MDEIDVGPITDAELRHFSLFHHVEERMPLPTLAGLKEGKVNLHTATEAEVSALTIKQLEDLNAELLGGAATLDDWRRQNLYVSWAIGCRVARARKAKKGVAELIQRFRRSVSQIERCERLGRLPFSTLRELLSDAEVPSWQGLLVHVPSEKPPLTEEQRDAVLDAHGKGASIREAAAAAGVSSTSARNFIKAGKKAEPLPPPPPPDDQDDPDEDMRANGEARARANAEVEVEGKTEETGDQDTEAAPAETKERKPLDPAKASERERRRAEKRASFPQALVEVQKQWEPHKAGLSKMELAKQARETLAVLDELRKQILADLSRVEEVQPEAPILTPRKIKNAAAMLRNGRPEEEVARILRVTVPELREALTPPSPEPQTDDLGIPTFLRREPAEAVH